MTKIKFTGATAIASNHEALTVGAVGLVVRFEFNSAWDGLHKTAVFHCGGVTKDVLDSSFPANICPIPWECLREEGETLYCGVYGTDSNGNIIIPSKMARLGTVHPGADPTGDESLDPTLPVWQQALNIAQDAMSQLAGKVNRSGDTMQGDLDIGTHTLRLGSTTGMTEDNHNTIRLVADREGEGVTLRNIDTPYEDSDAVNKKYVDDNTQPKGDYALRSELFSGSYNDLTNKPTIPTALPNPHKLTINGTSYDGTEDVQMTIQGGGESVLYVNITQSGSTITGDKTYAEILAAVKANKCVIAKFADANFYLDSVANDKITFQRLNISEDDESRKSIDKQLVCVSNSGAWTVDADFVAVDTAMSETSEMPVQNKVVKAYIDGLAGDISGKLDKTGGVINGNLGVTGALNIGATVSVTETNNNLLQLAGEYDAPVTIRNVATPDADNDAATKKYVDDHAGGITPHIGDNGNWYIGNTDTGKPSRGEQGVKGDTGPQGPQGVKGDTGPQGPQGIQGADYTLTEADKAEIADMVNGATIVQAPKYVNSTTEMTDINRPYVLISTGHIWANANVEIETTLTDTITATNDNPYHDGYRFGSDTASDSMTSGATGYFLTPLIDLTKAPYQGKTIQLHLDGAHFVSTGSFETWIQCRLYNLDKTVLAARPYIFDDPTNSSNVVYTTNGTISVEYHNETSATITITVPPTYGKAAIPIGYIRFCAKGAIANSNITITYIGTSTGVQWYDTGTTYGGGQDTQLSAKVAALNNEGNSPSTIKLLPKPVLDFYNSAAYPDNDYTVTHLSKITYPCRADIPVPFTVKWEYNEEAMRTTVAVDTRPIGTVNAYTMGTYDATGLNKYPIYNLLPNKTYYYKVTHVLSDGSLVEAKNGSFITSSEAWRLLYIDGTQNVRDLGGWTGLNGKKVKYGKIIRGAALNDSSTPELLLTGKGRRSLGELKIQAELNLGATDTETSIASNCVYKKIYYTNYAIAITGETYRAQFKEVLEWIVEQLTASKPIYMHCQGGCDRTGTLSFQLLGLLGVSESALAKEYELSSFSNIGFGRLRTTTQAVDTYDYVGMVEALKAYSGATVADKFYDFATTGCGISEATITNFRNLMLE